MSVSLSCDICLPSPLQDAVTYERTVVETYSNTEVIQQMQSLISGKNSCQVKEFWIKLSRWTSFVCGSSVGGCRKFWFHCCMLKTTSAERSETQTTNVEASFFLFLQELFWGFAHLKHQNCTVHCFALCSAPKD